MGLLSILTFYFLAAFCMVPSMSLKEAELLESLVGENSGYHAGVRPQDTLPTNVSVNMYVRSFLEVNPKDMTMKLQVTFRQKWFDPRLKYDQNYKFSSLKYLSIPSMSAVWHPDTFFRNSLETTINKDLDENFYVRVFPNGDVLQSVRMTVTLACPMSLQSYPFDVQNCPLMLASYASHKEVINYSWKETDPVQITNELYLPSYTLIGFYSDNCDVLTSTGEYSCLKATFTLARAASYDVANIMIPIAMFTAISWLALFIKREEMTTKIFLILISLVCISLKKDQVNSSLPNVAYTKVIDYWTGINTFLVFCALVHVILVNCLQKTIQEKQPQGLGLVTKIREAQWSVKIDLVGRIVFPVIFFLFIIIFIVCVFGMQSQCQEMMDNNPNIITLGGC